MAQNQTKVRQQQQSDDLDLLTAELNGLSAGPAGGLGYGSKHHSYYSYLSQEMPPKKADDWLYKYYGGTEQLNTYNKYKSQLAHAQGYGHKHRFYPAYFCDTNTF